MVDFISRLKSLFADEAPAKVLADPESYFVPNNDPAVQMLNGFMVRTDTDPLFEAGKTWDDLERTARNDQWVTAIQQRTAETKSAIIEVRAASEDAAAIEDAALVQQAFDGMRMRYLIAGLLDGIGYGAAFAEVIWEERGGLMLPARTICKHPQWFAFEDDGRILFMPDGTTPQEIKEPRKLLMFRNEPRDYRPQGLRLLAVVYWLTFIKANAHKWEHIYIKNFAVPQMAATYSGSLTPQQEAKLDAAFRAWQAGMGIRIPDAVKMQIIEASSKGISPMQAVVKSCDAAIAKVVLGGSLTVEASSSDGKGTQALGKTHSESLARVVADDVAGICEVLDTLAQWIIEINRGYREVYPYVSLIRHEATIDLERSKELREWIKLGAPVTLRQIREVGLIDAPRDGEELFVSAAANATDGQQSQAADGFAANSKSIQIESIDARASAAEAESQNLSDELLALAEERGVSETALQLTGWYTDQARSAAGEGSDGERMEKARQWLSAREAKLQAAEQAGGEPPNDAEPRLADAIYELRLFSRLFGEARIESEARAQLGDEFKLQFAAQYSSDKAEFEKLFQAWRVNPTEAIQSLKRRRLVGPQRWQDMIAEERSAALGFAYAPDYETSSAMRELLEATMDSGGSYADFEKGLNKAFAARGLDQLGSWYVETVFRTNMLSSYSRGRFEATSTPGMEKYFPYRRYATAGDAAVRPAHSALAGVYAYDDPIWTSHYPPLGYNCRCRVELVSEGRLEERGWKPTSGKRVLSQISGDANAQIQAALDKGFGDTSKWKKGKL